MKYAIRAALAAFCVTTAGAWAAGPASAPAVSAESIKMFPQLAAGQQRAVIALPALDNEADARVELMIGKTLPTDCNQQWFGGELTAVGLYLLSAHRREGAGVDADGMPRSSAAATLRAGTRRWSAAAVQQPVAVGRVCAGRV